MAREIKFRAKRLNNNEWIYGDLHLHSPFPHIHSTRGDKAKINTSTIGQCVGLQDKNSKAVYEGDIMGHLNEPNKCVVFWNGQLAQFQANWLNMPTAADIYTIIKLGYEVIGNIYDNPELLKSL